MGGVTRSSEEVLVMRMEQRGHIVQQVELVNQKWKELMTQAKPYSISKKVVVEAHKRVKARGGAAGVDEVTIEDFEKRLPDNLYKIWNRMSSGSYQAPAVRMVEIPKKQGGKRQLGIPTVSDRVAQMVVKMYLEKEVEPYFHEDSYGYRPGKSAIDAVGVARERCWRYDWVLDMDIKGFFDNINHELMMKAVKKHTEEKWIHLYIERWLKAPVEMEDGRVMRREKGTPQGGVISPLLANLYLHYAFDEWMKRNHGAVKFERYADDIVVHCLSLEEAERLKKAIGERLRECGLELHAEKTKIVYCKDSNRKGEHRNEKFNFLGYTFRSRSSRNRKNQLFVSFSPAVSDEAMKAMRAKIKGWKLQMRSGKEMADIAKVINPILKGWINYYGRYHISELRKVFNCLNKRLVKWAKRKYKRLRNNWQRATRWTKQVYERNPKMFAHWQIGIQP